MTESISRLIKRNTDMMEQKRIAELKALQAQINPHFLYNTLDAVNWLAKMKNQDDISNMITNLSRFFRNILNNGRDVVTIEEELNHSRAYIEIERFRYKNRFDVSFNLDIRLLKCLTLKLILQPFIENALVHGFKESNCRGRIVVQLFSVGDTVYFEVIDNGQGMDQACIDAVLTEKKEGYGIANVDERIKLQYGEQYGVSINSKKGEGTVVTIKIPKVERVEQDADTVDIEGAKPDEGEMQEKATCRRK